MASLVQRKLRISVRLAPQTGTNQPATFAGTPGSDVVAMENHRARVRVQNSGGLASSGASVDVWGLTPSLMNELATLGMVIQAIPRNTLSVAAGDDVSGFSTVFVGTIQQAYADLSSSPDVPFRFECLSTAAENAIPFAPSSYTGATDVVTVLSAIATRIGWGFENGFATSGVAPPTLANPYLSGSAVDQVRQVEEATQIRWALVPGSGTNPIGPEKVLAIWPRYKARRPPSGIPLVAPKPFGQMVGYPSYTQQGIMVKTVFDPRLIMGGQFKLQTSDPQLATPGQLKAQLPADGVWNILKLDLALDSMLPKGDWMSTIYGYNPNFPQVIPQAPA